MARRIDTQAVINSIRLVEQGSTPSTPASGYSSIFAKADGLYVVDDAGAVTGPFAVASGGSGLYSAYINIQEQQTSGTNGGTFTSGAWQTRVLNTEHADAGGHASISSNQITLAAGTYRCLIHCPAYAVNAHQARLQDITNTATLLTGTSAYTRATDSGFSHAIIAGRFTLAGSTVIEVQHRCQTTLLTNGWGVACGFGTEVYTIAEFWKE